MASSWPWSSTLQFKAILTISLFCGWIGQAYGWGFYAHRTINQYAVYAMPANCNSFFKAHLDYLSAHAVDPDKRRNAVEGEAPLHYIDIDHFEQRLPFDTMPHKWHEAVVKFTEDSLLAYGTLPWNILKQTKALEQAMSQKDHKRILRLAADLGHYVADATVPLHTTVNYDGQQTNQHGIHKLWETRVPELSGEHYNLVVGQAQYISDLNDWIWKHIATSHGLLPEVLHCEMATNDELPDSQQMAYVSRGQSTSKSRTESYAKAYEHCLDGMVENQMRVAILAVSSLWYTAWINAGQPELDVDNIDEPIEPLQHDESDAKQ